MNLNTVEYLRTKSTISALELQRDLKISATWARTTIRQLVKLGYITFNSLSPIKLKRGIKYMKTYSVNNNKTNSSPTTALEYYYKMISEKSTDSKPRESKLPLTAIRDHHKTSTDSKHPLVQSSTSISTKYILNTSRVEMLAVSEPKTPTDLINEYIKTLSKSDQYTVKQWYGEEIQFHIEENKDLKFEYVKELISLYKERLKEKYEMAIRFGG